MGRGKRGCIPKRRHANKGGTEIHQEGTVENTEDGVAERNKIVKALNEKKEELKASNKKKTKCAGKLEKFRAEYGNVLSEDDFIEYAKE